MALALATPSIEVASIHPIDPVSRKQLDMVSLALIAWLCLTLISLALLLTLKAIFNEVLPSRRAIALALVVFPVECIDLYFRKTLDRYFGDFGAPWVGKVLSICALVLFIKFACKNKSFKDIGVCLPDPKVIVATLCILLALIGITWGVVRHFAYHQDFSLALFACMLTISGLDEELVFRGVMPSMLMVHEGSRACMRVNRMIVFIVPTVIFTLVHVLRFTGGQFSFDGVKLCVIGIGACAFMYLRLRTGSLLNSLVVHNVVNAGTVVALALG